MNTQTILKAILFPCIIAFSVLLNSYAGEYPRTLTAYRGTTPVLDGYISEGEYADAEWITGVDGWHSGTNGGTACEDSLDLSVKVWYKHDGSYLYFAFDITDNLVYGFDTERWLPARNEDANSLERGVGWPWFGDGLEIMMNPSYTWDETKKSVGDGTIWQTIVSTHKSYAGGLEYGGLIQGVPYTEYAWTNYENWYENEHMKASVRIKTEEEGSGFVVEWRISPNPCMQTGANTFVDLSTESKVGINLEFEDLDNKEDGLGSGNIAEFRHVDFMTELEGYRKNIAKGFATLVLTPEKMNPDSQSTSISENYEASVEIPDSHSLVPGAGNEISVQTGECGNNDLVITKGSASDSAQVIVPFLWMNETVYSSFDLTPGQTGSSIHFDLMSEGKALVKISLEGDSIRYHQNGNSMALKIIESDKKYRIQIAADIQNKKYSLGVNGDMLGSLDFHDSTGTVADGFRIHLPADASPGSFHFDNLIIQEEAIDSSEFYDFEDCWDLAYDYEASLSIPEDHIVSAESLSDVSVKYSSNCDNNYLLISDSSAVSSTRVELPFEDVEDVVHVQFAVDSRQDTASIYFSLGEGESKLVNVGLNENGKIFYFENESSVDWLDYESYTKYSIQIIADVQAKEYDLIVGSDTVHNIGFFDGTAGKIDKLSIESPDQSTGDFRIDNLAVANRALAELVFSFNDCVGFVTGLSRNNATDGQIKLYPNPSSGYLTIEFGAPHPGPVVITDMYGRVVHRAKGSMDTSLEMDLHGLPSGLYLINLNNRQGRVCRLIQLVK